MISPRKWIMRNKAKPCRRFFVQNLQYMKWQVCCNCWQDVWNVHSRSKILLNTELENVVMPYYHGLIFTRPLLQKGSSLQEEILSVCLSVCVSVRLSVITFSFYEYSIIWWFTLCKPYILWKFIMLATSPTLFWPSTTEYQPVPTSSDPVFNALMA